MTSNSSQSNPLQPFWSQTGLASNGGGVDVRRLLEESLRDESARGTSSRLHNWQDSSHAAAAYNLGPNLDSHFLNIHGGAHTHSAASAAFPPSITGTPYYQNFLQSMNNEADQQAISRSVANLHAERDILDDLYKILGTAEPQASELAEAQSRAVENAYQFSTQHLTDNFDLANFGATVDAETSAWLALQQQNQNYTYGLSDLANATSRRMEQLQSMLPNHSGLPMSLQAQAPNFGAVLAAQGRNQLSGADPSSLLAALLSESVPPIDAAHLSNSNGFPTSQVTATTATTSKKQAPSAAKNNSSRPTPKLGHQLPFRALSAYNFFFRDERDRIINGGENEFTAAKKQQLLAGHWFRDRTVKRRHRKTHGKIAFTTLSKQISQGWKDLTDDKKAFYREVAAEDLDRYQRELDQCKMMEAQGALAASNA